MPAKICVLWHTYAKLEFLTTLNNCSRLKWQPCSAKCPNCPSLCFPVCSVQAWLRLLTDTVHGLEQRSHKLTDFLCYLFQAQSAYWLHVFAKPPVPTADNCKRDVKVELFSSFSFLSQASVARQKCGRLGDSAALGELQVKSPQSHTLTQPQSFQIYFKVNAVWRKKTICGRPNYPFYLVKVFRSSGNPKLCICK